MSALPKDPPKPPLYQIGWDDGKESGRFGKPREKESIQKVIDKLTVEGSALRFFLVEAV